MRNIFIKHIDALLICYYKEVDYELLAASWPADVSAVGETCRREAMRLIDLMKELELVSSSEHVLLREVYMEYFSV